MALQPLEQIVIFTLAYTTQFQYPLTPAELVDRLLVKLDEGAPIETPTRPEVAETIKRLLHRRILNKIDDYLVLIGFEATVQVRNRRQVYTAAKQPELSDFVALIEQCHWIEAVFVTGSQAMANGDKDADIDFLIVTQPRRLWLTRLWLLWQAMRRGKRRSWQGEEKGNWCFNLWLESDQLGIFKHRQSLYTAYELLQALPLFDRSGRVASDLIQRNNWVREFLPLAAKWQGPNKTPSVAPKTQNKLLDALNLLAYYFHLAK